MVSIKQSDHAPGHSPAHENMAVLGTGQIHTQHEHQVREAVGHRPADSHNGGIAIVGRDNPQQGNQRPANHITKRNGRHAGDDFEVGTLSKGAQIGPIDNGRLDKSDPGQVQHHLFYWRFEKFHGAFKLLALKINKNNNKRN
jgi:hypothetical protein